MSHKLNDAVLLVTNGVEREALVHSAIVKPDIHPGFVAATEKDIPLVEHLNLVYLTDQVQGVQNVTALPHNIYAITVFSVRPLVDGLAQGWKELETEPSSDWATQTLKAQLAEAESEVEQYKEAIGKADEEAANELARLEAAHLNATGEQEQALKEAIAEIEKLKAELAATTEGRDKALQAHADAVVAAAALEAAHPDPIFETKHYEDGSSATGVAPLPDKSPDEQAPEEHHE